MMRVIAIKNGIRCEILLGDLVDLIAAEVKAALLEEGFVSQADIDAPRRTPSRSGQDRRPRHDQDRRNEYCSQIRQPVIADGTLGERQIRVVTSDPTVDRVKDVMVPEGCVLDGYKSNPIVLFNHDPHSPVGNAAVAIQNGRVEALIDFAQKGISAKADEICGALQIPGPTRRIFLALGI